MIELFTNFFLDVIGEAQGFVNLSFSMFSNIVFYVEKFILEESGVTGFNLQKMWATLYGAGITLLTVKCLISGFNRYILWTDGDPDNPPIEMLVKSVKALAVSACFPTLYKWLVDITQGITTLLLQAIGILPSAEMPGLSEIISGSFVLSAIRMPFIGSLLALAYLILILVLMFQFIKKGVEVLIMRLGVPIAVIGFIENDGGASKNYFKIFFQSALGVMVQIVLFKLSVGLWVSCQNIITAIIAIVLMFMAVKAPKFLAQFLVQSGGGGSAVSNLYFASSMASRAASLFKK